MTPSISPTDAFREIRVRLGSRSYPIAIGAGMLTRTDRIESALGGQVAALVSNEVVYRLHGAALLGRLEQRGIKVVPIVIADGEQSKSWDGVDSIVSRLLEQHCGRGTTILALGGGVIGDLAGFAAAIYQRGIPFVQIPTTLLAQVDSSVGGKTGINHPLGKNMIGAFHQPKSVIVDTETLSTLPDREFRSGLAEVIKYGLIDDAPFFFWIEEHISRLLDREPTALTEAIARSVQIKARIVADDELETAQQGGRALLNLGHTFAHAIETELGYGRWLHGEAVSCGMVLAAQYSSDNGALSPDNVVRISRLLDAAGLPVQLPGLDANSLASHMARDKKNDQRGIRLILLRAIGQAYAEPGVSTSDLAAFLASQLGNSS